MSEQAKRYWPEEIVGTGELVVYAQDYDALRAEAESLRAENGRMQADRDRANQYANQQALECNKLSTDLEAARGLLRDMRIAARINPSCQYGMVNPCRCGYCADLRVDAFLTATTAPEVQDHTERNLEMARQALSAENQRVVPPEPIIAPPHPFDKPSLLRDCNVTYSNSSRPLAEQGERQEAVAWIVPDFGFLFPTEDAAQRYLRNINDLRKPTALYATPQPGQDVRSLAASLYQACSAYDMPERILDALSAAANGKPFAHMIDGLLPCVPPSDQEVRALVEALEECAASLAWNCFGECRAIHAGPIMPAAMALDTARAALSTHRQAQRQ